MAQVFEKGMDLRGKRREEFGTVNEQESRTIQSDAVEADIKTIMLRSGISGVIDHLSEADLVFGDVSELGDYAEVMRVVRAAEAEFMKLPPKVREVFDHDAAKWLDAANDGISEDQKSRLVELGVIKPSGKDVRGPEDPVDVSEPVAPLQPVPEG